MKNTLKIIALSGLFVGTLFAVEGLSINGSVGFESEYVFRGMQQADESLQATVEVAYDIYGGSAYAGLFVNEPIATTADTNEIDLYIGYQMPVFEDYTADFGYISYLYPSDASVARDTREIYAGLTYNGLYVNPAAYVYYDFDLEQIALQLSGDYSIDLADYGVENTTVDFGMYWGVLSAQDADGAGADNGYEYCGLTADAVYHFTADAAASVGVRFTGNNDDVATGSAQAQREKNAFWGFKFAAGF